VLPAKPCVDQRHESSCGLEGVFSRKPSCGNMWVSASCSVDQEDGVRPSPDRASQGDEALRQERRRERHRDRIEWRGESMHQKSERPRDDKRRREDSDRPERHACHRDRVCASYDNPEVSDTSCSIPGMICVQAARYCYGIAQC
jgi:hypothetical protein